MSPRDDRDIRATLSTGKAPNGVQRLSTDPPGAMLPSLAESPAQRLLASASRSGGGYRGPYGSWWVMPSAAMVRGWSWWAGGDEHCEHSTALSAAVEMLEEHPELAPGVKAGPGQCPTCGRSAPSPVDMARERSARVRARRLRQLRRR